MLDIIKQLLTGKDNVTHDIIKHLGLWGFAWFLCAETAIIFKTGVFDVVGFSTAFGLIIGSISAGLKIKESTEPDPPEK